MEHPRTRKALVGFSTFLSLFSWALAAHAQEGGDLFTQSLKAHGLLAALPSAFLVGLATAATPCVYPMIAITVSVFGARKASRGRAIALSSMFVLGIAAMFVPLGLAAGLTGSVAGKIAGSAAMKIFEAVLMFAMAASMFGAFEISLPGSVQNRLASVGGLGLKGAFLIGLATGPIAAPCATAGLVGILDYVFQTKNVLAGGLALFSYSLGLGAPFFFVGAFAVGLPKPGQWMEHVKSVFGLVLVAVGLFYLRGLLPGLDSSSVPKFPGAPWSFLALLLLGLAVGAVHLSLKDGTWIQRTRKLVGIGVFALGATWFRAWEPASMPAPSGNQACQELRWTTDLGTAEAQAQREHRPLLLDFGATWCAACEELAHKTFRASEVACTASQLRYIPVKLYEDQDPPANYQALVERYHIRGLPTVIVLDPSGRELVRETQFVEAPRMVQILRRVEGLSSAR